MYKTIRHGENSLQYTILPQTDEGKSSNGTERRRRSCGSKRGQKKSLVAYIGLFFVCAVVTGAILVPLMVTTDLMPSPAAWFFKAQKARELRNPATVKYVIEKNNNILNSDAEKKLNISNLIIGGNLTDITTTTILQSSSVFDSTTFQDTSPSTIPTVTSTVLPPLPTSTSTEPEATEIEATVMLNISTITEVLSTVITSTIQPTILPTTELEILSTSEIPKNPSKPKILLQEIRKHAMMKNIPVKIDDVRIDKTDEEKKNWIKSHWPFVDPSSYFQWAGYDSEDRVLLPAILGAALIIIFLIIAICILVRNKKSFLRKRDSFGRLSHETHGEDNTTLLTNADNGSDDE